MVHDRRVNGTPRRVIGLVALAGLFSLPGVAADSNLEYRVKAAFLLNFTKFIDWPATAFANAQAPLEICLFGKNPFGTALDEVLEGETVDGRKLVARQIMSPPVAQTCQVLFVDAEQKDVAKVFANLPPAILTVGEGERFLKDGGMVSFVLDNRRVRFDINQIATEKGAMKPSSRLLAVARLVTK